MGFPRQEYWSGLPCPSPEDLPDPGIKPWSHELQADYLLSELQGSPLMTSYLIYVVDPYIGKEFPPQQMDIQIHITDSLCCIPETNTTL